MSRRWCAAFAIAMACAAGCGDGSEPVAEGDTVPPAPTTTVVAADDIAVAHTPPGGWTAPPGPVLADCSEPLADGAPDLRGLWRAVSANRDGTPLPAGDRALSNVQRVEQCGDRVTITSSGIVHDMRADGSVERGVHDVAEIDRATPVHVVATFEDGVHVLRPVGLDVEVTRRLEGERMIWTYLGTEITLERIGGPSDPFPTTTTTTDEEP